MRPLPMTLPPLILLSGDSFSQETKWFSVFHLLISHPTSLTTVIAVMTSMPSIWVRSVPVDLLFRCAVKGRFRYSDLKEAIPAGYGMGVAAGDYDGDGLPDLYLTQYGRSILYRNNGGWHVHRRYRK